MCCLYVPGPQWLTVGDPAADGTEATYRSLLVGAVPEADDDRFFGRGVAASALTWALLRLGRLALLEERGPGHESRTQMVATLDAAARTAGRFGCFPAVRGWVRRAEQRLRDRWPDADVDLGALPPYSRRGERPRPGAAPLPL